ncbi:MAG TPA: ribonuclease III [Armatimonadota bacterium]|nr:ribonuclease III [Armatimonadota bacterium]
MPDKPSNPSADRAAPDPSRPRPRRRAPRAGDAEALAAKLDITLHRPGLLRQAITHKSAEQEMHLPSNERLEFLGDSVLDLVLAEYLYRGHPELAEGDLTKLKAVAVSEPILAAIAGELGLGRYLLLAKGEEQTGGRNRSSILADAMEALFAAVYLDRGLRLTRSLILRLLGSHLEAIERREHEPDYKTLLQEKIQEIHRNPPTYRVVSQTGPDHDRTFVAEVRIGRTVLGSGQGKSKKQAEQAAARQALMTKK